MLKASVGPAREGKMGKKHEWRKWFQKTEAILGMSSNPQKWGSGNDNSWIVVKARSQFLPRGNI